MTPFFFPAKHALRAPARPSLGRISRAIQPALAAILVHASSGLTAAADAIATIAVATIAVAVADQIAVADVPAAVLDSNVVPAAVRIVITAATLDLRAVLSLFLKC